MFPQHWSDQSCTIENMKKILNRDHILIQSAFYVCFAALAGFGTFMMLIRGYSAGLIGILIALANFASIIFNYLISWLQGKHRSINAFRMSVYVSLILLLLYIGNAFFAEPSLALSLDYLLCIALTFSLVPLIESLNSTLIKNGVDIHFGVARSFGSLSFGISCIVFGYIASGAGWRAIAWLLVIFQVLLILFLALTAKHFDQIDKIEETPEERETIGFRGFLGSHRAFFLTCLGYAGLMGCFGLIMENFLLPILQSVGGTAVDNGIVQGIKAFIEVPFIFCFHLIERRYALRPIFVVAVASFIVKCVIMFAARSVVPIYASQILQGTSLALLLPAFVSYINRIMKRNEIALAYALQAMCLTAVQMLLNAFGGYVLDLYGVRSLVMLATVLTALSGFLLLRFLQPEADKKA